MASPEKHTIPSQPFEGIDIERAEATKIQNPERETASRSQEDIASKSPACGQSQNIGGLEHTEKSITEESYNVSNPRAILLLIQHPTC